jgi:hypothetical protein
MTRKLEIERIWWRNVQPGEFYNIERHHQISGGGGSLYIEIPASLVPETLDFLGVTRTALDSNGQFEIEARSVGQPSLSGPITFKPKSGGRMRIANQNRQQPNSQRHPAWTSARGFPKTPDGVSSTKDALPHFPAGGLRIYIAKSVEGDYYAGFTKGPRPAKMQSNDPMWDLYPPRIDKPVGGVINEA